MYIVIHCFSALNNNNNIYHTYLLNIKKVDTQKKKVKVYMCISELSASENIIYCEENI